MNAVRTNQVVLKAASTFVVLVSQLAFCQNQNDIENCLISAFSEASSSATVSDLKKACEPSSPTTDNAGNSQNSASKPPDEIDNSDIDATYRNSLITPLALRIAQEQSAHDNPFALTPHRPNYILPFVFIEQPNQAPFQGVYAKELDQAELQFQLSLKAVILDNILGGRGQLVGAYTIRAFWQAYSTENSRPFRETNHEPEVILSITSRMEIMGFRNMVNSVALNHQSNGQSAELSRSWNRVMLQTVWERGNVALQFRPWYRIPERKDEFEGDPSGDDNPDITDYLGNFDLQGAYNRGDQTFSLMVRNNLDSTNRGAIELGWSFPLSSRVGGFIKYFNGYGESLIDYDAHTQSLGFGIELNDWL